ncbi:thioredoxin family protein [Sphingomonas oligoaromativorans]|uniref:thioredoxin family protein n=1 Tax=Sphingomonas oligoaromativorans TaxID=575322 RepID=UPI0014243EF5|nr:thioredoxin family protein [Sphingomonas oligoaromativorans]NIJ35125.1 thiol-disulfide isomerase/thioredoxin [Sphingomonas oligoaromativorans]
MLKTFLLVALLALAAVPAAAQPIRPFSIAALKAAQAKGEPVLIDAFAPWCPTCRAQAPALDAIAASPDYAKLVILRLDYDHQIAEKKALGINQQSTLIAFKGSREVGRTLGVTQADQIKAFAATPLK